MLFVVCCWLLVVCCLLFVGRLVYCGCCSLRFWLLVGFLFCGCGLRHCYCAAVFGLVGAATAVVISAWLGLMGPVKQALLFVVFSG